ncbi:beta-lactamase class A [Microbacterium sp. SLBN-154]|uniref:class A beta-lactamase n=1 Tax=Microbacterium sp. SLBN-154 TaxID=2768458 RepID=UPI0011545693|nr:class A beta-lactamase [Microbacterium sp. SLBN-154]TQK18568.1 beta-lactamase class A [Microbacterium sp. SLBN-154]
MNTVTSGHAQRIRRTAVGVSLAASLALVAPACATSAPGGASPTSSPSRTDAAAPTPSAAPTIDVTDELSSLEEQYDARVGVYAVDTGTGETVAHRADERFAYASTFKALLAAVVLQQVDDLDQQVAYGADALVTYSPVTEQYAGSGMSVADLAEAAVRVSDNTAANLLLDQIGGPEGLAAALTAAGDDTTRPERREPELNTAVPDDPRDTSTPRALAETLRGFALDGGLSEDDAATLIDWMSGNATGDTLIRAGAPSGWDVADKSGTGQYGTRNDLAIVWPPDGEPIVVAVLTTRGVEGATTDDALVAAAAATALEALD